MTRTLIKITLAPATLARVEAARRTLAPPGLEPLSRSSAVAVLVERGLAVTEGPTSPVTETSRPPAGWEEWSTPEKPRWFRELHDLIGGPLMVVVRDDDGTTWRWSGPFEIVAGQRAGGGRYETAIEAMRAADAAWAEHQEVDRG